MPTTTISSNMNLPIPIVGVDPGPDYAQNINSCLNLLDLHDHSPGSGVQITPDGLNINSDLAFNDSNATLVRTVRFSAQDAVLSDPTDIACLYAVDDDLYFNDGSGNQVRITQSGNVAGSAGSISGLSSPASATYVSGSTTFVWQSAANTPANMDGGSVILRNITGGSFGLTLDPPAAMGSNYTITLPSLPGSTLPLQISSAGAMSTGQIATAQIADLAVTEGKLASNAVTTAKIADAAVTQAKMAAMPAGTSASAGGIAVATSSGNSTQTISSFTTLTNQSITITTTGRPVRLQVQGDSSNNASYIEITAASGGSVRFVRNGSTNLGRQNLEDNIRYPSSQFSYTDTGLAAGTYTYTFEGAQATSGNFDAKYLQLVAYEL